MNAIIISSALLANSVYGWGMNGHMFAAKMAQDRLEEYYPDSFDAALTSL